MAMRTGLLALTFFPQIGAPVWTLAALVAALLFLLGVVALVLQIIKLHTHLNAVTVTITRQAREQVAQQKLQIDDLRTLIVESQRELASLRKTADKIFAETTRATTSSNHVVPPVTPIPRSRPSREFEFSAEAE